MIAATRRVAPRAAEESFGALVLAGLGETPKRLPTRFLYDAEGSALFEAITALPEYYLTRAETEVLRAHAREILAGTGAREIVEFGSGSSEKTRLLLAELERQADGTGRYVPIDISSEFLSETAGVLGPAFPGLTIAPVAAEYFDALAAMPSARERRLILFLGSNVGNFDDGGAEAFLGGVRERMGPGDSLLLGLDLVKPEAELVAAYDDARGVTARFTTNLLVRANRELGADFDLAAFRHFAQWNAAASRMEMGLLTVYETSVRITDREFRFAKDERIHTEFSRKYTRDSAERLARGAGLRVARWWTDDRERFADALLEPVS